MPLNLNSDKLIIVCKPDQYPVVTTGYTPTIIVGSGGTTVSQSGITWIVSSPSSVLPTVLIGSGNTTTTNISGNTWSIYTPTGATSVAWGDITGTLNNQVDLKNALDSKSGTGHTHTGVYAPVVHTHSQYSLTGHTHVISNVTGLQSALDGKSSTGHTHTGVYAPVVHTHAYSAITNTPNFVGSGNTTVTLVGDTYRIYSPTGGTGTVDHAALTNLGWLDSNHTGQTSQLAAFGLSGETVYVDPTDFAAANHTHSQYSLTGHTHVISNVTGLQSALDGKSDTGHTHSQYALNSNLTGHTSDNTIHFKMSGITITESQVSGLTASLAGKSGTGHTHSQYLTGVTWNDVTDKPDVALNADLTGLTQTVNSHTGDTSIHFKMSDITGFTSSNDFNTFTGTTLPNNYYNQTEVDNLISGFTTGYTFVESGATQISVVGNQVTIYSPTPTGGTGSTVTLVGSGATEVTQSGSTWIIYSPTPTGGTGSGSWNDVTDKPAWLSGTTLSAFEAQHSHDTLYQPILASLMTVTGTTDIIANTDSGKVIKYNNTSARTVTLPTGLTTNLQFTAINYGGTTAVTFQAGTGATLRSKNSALKLATIYGACTWIHEGNGTWIGFGDLTV